MRHDGSLPAALRALVRRLAKLVGPVIRLLRPRSLSKLAGLPRPDGAADSVVDRLRDTAIAGWLRPGSPGSEEEGGGADRPHEADLPNALAQANGLPIQHATLVAVPVEIAYNQFTQLEALPSFMHAVAKVEQIDAARADFELRRWGLRRRWRAHIVDQRPDERIAWRSVCGVGLAGVTSFHSISDRLTRMDVSVVVEPAGRLPRMVRRLGLLDHLIADELHRFKAFIEMREEETGAWRGYIADGEVVEEHDYFGWDEEGPEEGAAEHRDSEPPGADEREAGTGMHSPEETGKDAWGRASATNGASARTSQRRGARRTRAPRQTGSSRSRA